MILGLLYLAVPSLLVFMFTRILTNILFDIFYGLLKLIVKSIFKLIYNLIAMLLWILFLPLTITTKMTVSKASPLRWLILLTLMAVSAFVAYDVSLHGTFQKSQTGQALKDAGVLQAYDKFAFRTRIAYSNASKWFSKNGPTFLKQAADSLVPYLVLMKNLLILFSNAVVNGMVTFVKYVAVKLPLLHEAIESYCPGITEWSQKAIQNLWAQFLQLVQYLAAQSVTIMGVVFQYLKQVFAQVTEYLQKNVLVGDYSPENLQKAAFQGLSLAQEYVSSSVTWLSHKLNGLATQ